MFFNLNRMLRVQCYTRDFIWLPLFRLHAMYVIVLLGCSKRVRRTFKFRSSFELWLVNCDSSLLETYEREPVELTSFERKSTFVLKINAQKSSLCCLKAPTLRKFNGIHKARSSWVMQTFHKPKLNRLRVARRWPDDRIRTAKSYRRN